MNKNIHVLPNKENVQYIYITDDSEIRDCWVLNTRTSIVYFAKGYYGVQPTTKKIILTTNQYLIGNDVQAIEDEFLEWFVKNPSCEEVDVVYRLYNPMGRKVSSEKVSENHSQCVWKYKIIIPQETPEISDEAKERAKNYMALKGALEVKEETLEEYIKEVTKNFGNEMSIKFTSGGMKLGAKWQAERMYSEEDMQEYAEFCIRCDREGLPCIVVKDWFEQFKKK
jgi:hypothetical protein